MCNIGVTVCVSLCLSGVTVRVSLCLSVGLPIHLCVYLLPVCQTVSESICRSAVSDSFYFIICLSEHVFVSSF